MGADDKQTATDYSGFAKTWPKNGQASHVIASSKLNADLINIWTGSAAKEKYFCVSYQPVQLINNFVQSYVYGKFRMVFGSVQLFSLF